MQQILSRMQDELYSGYEGKTGKKRFDHIFFFLPTIKGFFSYAEQTFSKQ